MATIFSFKLVKGQSFDIILQRYCCYVQEAESCMDQPILSYLLRFQNSMETYLFNETGVVLGPKDGLEENQKYAYTATAINSNGNATSHNKSLCE